MQNRRRESIRDWILPQGQKEAGQNRQQKVENLFGSLDAPLPYPQISSCRLQKNLDSDSWTDVGYREYEEYQVLKYQVYIEYDIYNNMIE